MEKIRLEDKRLNRGIKNKLPNGSFSYKGCTEILDSQLLTKQIRCSPAKVRGEIVPL